MHLYCYYDDFNGFLQNWEMTVKEPAIAYDNFVDQKKSKSQEI